MTEEQSSGELLRSMVAAGPAAVSSVVTGTLDTLIATDEDGTTSREHYLHTGESSLRLFGGEALEGLTSGRVLTVRGQLGTQGLTIAPGGVSVQPEPPSPVLPRSEPSGSEGTPPPDQEEYDGEGEGTIAAVRTVLVININFPDRTSQPWTVTSAHNVFNTSVANWFNQASYGRTTISADAVGWYRISAGSQTCNSSTWASQAQAAARARGIEPNSYNHVVIAFPRVPACGWAGLGQVPGRITWLNGTTSMGVAVHELGHNLGLGHSNARRCSTGPLSGSCTTTEYGDRYDRMGSGGAHFHASFKAHLGWIPTSSRVTVTNAQREHTVALRPAESSSGTRLLRVRRSGRSDYLHVEVRQATGYSSELSRYSALMNGVAVYLGTNLNAQSIVDVGYTTADAGDAALRVGQILWDRTGNVLILPMQRVNNTVYVYVQYGWAG